MENGLINENQTSEKILIGLIQDDDNVYIRRQELVKVFNGDMSVFEDEYYVIATMIKEHIRISVDTQFLKLYLKSNIAVFSRSRYVNLSRFSISEVDAYTEFTQSCVAIFEECSKKTITDSEFLKALEMHKMIHINAKAFSTLEFCAEILGEGKTVKGRRLNSFNDMNSHLKSEFLKLENMLTKSDRKGIITYGVNDDEEEGDKKIKLVCTFGVKALDEHINIYEGDMVSLLAPAKGCKSRFTTQIIHNAIVNHGVNIVMWSVENGYKGWEALLRARHFNHFYNDKATEAVQKRLINDDMIRKGNMDSDLEELELASWTDLKSNPSYGKITVIDEDLNPETFLEIMENAVNSTGAKLICIDYLQLLTSTRGISKNEAIGNAYKQMLQFLKKKKIAGVFPAQLKQTVVGNLDKVSDEDLINTELRDAAGESYEVIKTPDINLALYGTPEDIRNGSMKILSIPSRNSAPFEPINMYVDPGSCSFYSIDKAI